MKYSLSIIISLIILQSNVSSEKCENIKYPVKLSPINLSSVISALNSQKFAAEFISDIVRTEFKLFGNLRNFRKYKQGLRSEDVHLSTSELLQKYGYPAKEHTVTTKDGYILTLYFVAGKGANASSPHVLLGHGIIASSDVWVTAGPENAMVYFLANNGYNVWLANYRGNIYSRKHVSRSPECAEFWNFTWHESGIYDLPAMIDYILEETGQEKLAYIGHSQGTTVFYVLCSLQPAYCIDKIAIAITLAPIAYMSHLRCPFARLFAPSAGVLDILLQSLGKNELFTNNPFTQAISTEFCGATLSGATICDHFVNLLTGFDIGQLNISNIGVMLSHNTAGAATKAFVHFGQEVDSKRFCQFDNGVNVNFKVYGTEQPPEYPLQNIKVPVALFASANDWLSSLTDVDILNNQLSNVVEYRKLPKYNHADYQFAINLNEYINQPILRLLKKYLNNKSKKNYNRYTDFVKKYPIFFNFN